MREVLLIASSFDLIWTLPFPYDNITDVRSEGCPGLDTRSFLKVQG